MTQRTDEIRERWEAGTLVTHRVHNSPGIILRIPNDRGIDSDERVVRWIVDGEQGIEYVDDLVSVGVHPAMSKPPEKVKGRSHEFIQVQG